MYLHFHEQFFLLSVTSADEDEGLTLILCHVILWFSQMITTRICVF